MLLYGPPGCGKTYLAIYISARLGLPLLTARCDSLMSSFLGSTAKNIRNLFDHASNRPCVLFLDEFDSLAKARDDQHEVGELKRIVVGLLQNIDALPPETVLLAATNHEKLLDPAVWRRFSYRLHIQPPSVDMREKLFHQYLKEYSPKSTRIFAVVADGMSGALIRQACEAAIRSTIINNESEVGEYKLLSKLAVYLYADVIQSALPTEEKVRQLKESNSRLFTHRVLSEIFHISTGTITNITAKARV
jgi:SpoVK/Ycf46/Vps4 family AAA+-type ATPase